MEDRTALIFLKNGEEELLRLTFAEVDLRARAVAACLQQQCEVGERALLMFPPGPEFVAGFLGCLYAGVVAIPAYPPKPNKDNPRLRAIIADSKASLALTTAETAAAIARRPESVEWSLGIRVLPTDTLDLAQATLWREPLLSPEFLAFLQYTSGSTGDPKGVMVTQANLVAHARALTRAFKPDRDSVFVTWLPAFHDMGLIAGILDPLHKGYPCVMMAPAAFLQRPLRWLQAITRYRGTISAAPNFAYELCTRQISDADMTSLDLSSWRLGFNAAEPCRRETIRAFSEKFAACGLAPDTVSPAFGLAEATLIVSYGSDDLPVRYLDLDAAALESGRYQPTSDDAVTRTAVSCGRPDGETSAVIVEPGGSRPCDAGEIGEVLVQSPTVALGYYEREATNREVFRARVDGYDGLFMRTGDLGFLHEGELFITGRHKDLIIIHGVNHYPQDIEQSAQICHPSLQPDAGAAFSITVDGEEVLVVAQEVRRTFMRKLDPGEVMDAISLAVAAEHEINVHAIALVRPGGILKTSSGKIQRRGNRAAYEAGELRLLHLWEQPRAGVRPVSLGEPRPARDAREAAIIEIWQRELGIAPIGIDDHFFRLGGQSLQAVRIGNALAEHFDKRLPADLLYKAPTPARLAEALDALPQAGDQPTALDRSGPQPLSSAQQRLWFLYRLDPSSALYNLFEAIELRGQLDESALRAAFTALIERHESLRTRFSDIDGDPVQCIDADCAFLLPCLDLRHLSEARREEMVMELARREAASPFDLEQGPLLRAQLLRCEDDRHVLLFAIHHIIADGWSSPVLKRDLGTFYQKGSLAPLPFQYADYAVWQRNWLAQHGESQRAWWRDYLHELPLTELPTDHVRPETMAFRGGRANVLLSRRLSGVLRQLGNEAGTTLYCVLLSAYYALIARYCGASDLVVGTPIANRGQAGLAEQIGFFVNTLPLRADLSGNPSFTVLLARVHALSAAAFSRPDIPFDLLVEEAMVPRDPSRNPLFQLMFSFLDRDESQHLQGLTMRDLPVTDETAVCDLSLNVTSHKDGLSLEAEYDRDLFEPATIDHLLRHYVQLLRAFGENPDQPVHTTPMLSAEDLAQLAGYRATDPGPGLLGMIRAQVADRPHALALEGEEQLSYAQMQARVDALAAALRGSGMGPEDRIGLFLPRGCAAVIATLAVLQLGAAYVPLDPDYPADRLTYMLADAGIGLVLTDRAHRKQLPANEARIVLVDAAHRSVRFKPVVVPEEALAYVIYTSGSTGRPKGVMISRAALDRYCRDAIAQLALSPADRILQFASAAFDVTVEEYFPTLMAGATLVIPPATELADPASFTRAVTAYRLSGFEIPTHFWSEWTAHLQRTGQRPASSLRFVTVGTERILPERLLQWQAHGVLLNHVFGLTEATVTSLMFRFSGTDAPLADSFNLPIGKPVGDTAVLILDRQMQPVPVGVAGEIHVGGRNLARGYRGRPGLTAERFVPNPYGDSGSRLYKAGDLGRRNNAGEIVFLGRLDSQLKIRGYRIEPGEIEAALLQHEALAGAVVVGRVMGGGDKRLVAYLIASGADTPGIRELREFLAERLPEYMQPEHHVYLERFPVSPNGKLDYKALPDPGADRELLESRFQAADSVTEAALSVIWQEVLGRERVGIDDNYFELGGNSLNLLKLQSRIERDLGRRIEVVQLFRFPTIRALARHIDGDQPRPLPVVPTAAVSADEPLAIIGLACRFGDGEGPDAFWQLLAQGGTTIRHMSTDELIEAGEDAGLVKQSNYVPAKGVMVRAEFFDAAFFGLSPREAESTDPQQRVFLEQAWQVMEDAGYDPFRYEGRVGVFAGCNRNTYYEQLIAPGVAEDPGAAGVALDIGNAADFLATRVAYKLNLRGPAMTIQTACSTSLVAVDSAVRAMRTGACEMAIAGGISIHYPALSGHVFQSGGIGSPDGFCRAFDARAGGTVRGDGCGLILLKPLSAAVNDGDAIRAVLRGTATNNDGDAKVGFTAPGVDGQAEVIRAAQRAAGVSGAQIGYVETHGTGTPLGDPTEIAALSLSFGGGDCAIGSVKTNLGHTDTAAGIAGLIKVVLSLQHGQIPPSLNFESPNPQIDFAASPFHVNTSLCDWPEREGSRLAGVSSFGIGGTNAHAILEQAPTLSVTDPGRKINLLVFSAKSAAALEAQHEHLAAANIHANHNDVAFTLQLGRARFEHRGFQLASATTRGTFERNDGNPSPLPVAFLMTGQGSQYPNMGRDLYEGEPVFRAAVDRCCDYLAKPLGLDLRDLLYPQAVQLEAAAQQLARTRFTQPALFVHEYASAMLWQSWGQQPVAMLGHSVGEYVAATLAGVFQLEAALDLIALRGSLIDGLPAGDMLALRCSADQVAPLLGDEVALAANNGPANVTVSGPAEAIAALSATLKDKGIAHQALHTSHAFHSAMMNPILGSFRAAVVKAAPQAPTMPFVSNLSGDWITTDQATDPAYWAQHLRGTVRFAEGLTTLLADRPLALIEVGPGMGLLSLARKLKHEHAALLLATTPGPKQVGENASVALSSLGKLWLCGNEIDWQGFYGEQRRRRVPLPTYPFEREAFLLARSKQSAPRARGVGKAARFDDWFFRESWLPTSLPSTTVLPPQSWLVFLDKRGLGAELVSQLRAAGHTVVTVVEGQQFGIEQDGYHLRWAEAEDHAAMLADLADHQRLPDQVLHLGGMIGDGASSFARHQELGLTCLTQLSAALAAQEQSATQKRTTFTAICEGLCEVSGAEELVPARATLLGFNRVLAQEVPGQCCKLVDLDVGQLDRFGVRKTAALLLRELAAEGDDILVALRGRRRFVEGFEPMNLPTGELVLKQDGTYLITGARGAIGTALAEYLFKNYGAKLVLLGRSEPTNDRLEALRREGARMLCFAADVADTEALERVFAEAERQLAPVDGVFHAAGITDDAFYQPIGAELDPTPHYAAKVHGLAALDAVLSNRTPDFVLLFSSIATRLGGLGHAAYVAANAYMDRFAAVHNRNSDTLWQAVDWEGWRLGHETVGSAGAELAELALSAEEGMAAIERILASREERLIVSTGDLAARHQRWVLLQDDTEAVAHARGELSTDFVAPRGEFEQELADLWAELLGLDRVGIDDDFFELGGDSLLAVHLASRLWQRTGLEANAALVLAHPTVAELSVALVASAAEDEDLSDLLAELDDLSDEDAELLLNS